jgi:hypothetical protein
MHFYKIAFKLANVLLWQWFEHYNKMNHKLEKSWSINGKMDVFATNDGTTQLCKF